MAKRKSPVTPETLLKLVGVGDAQMSPDGRSVLFQRKVVGARNSYETTLWVAATDGRGTPRQLTHGPKDSHGRWSPDGSRIAFIRSQDKKAPQIALLPTQGGEALVATALPEGTIRDFAWSPCGERIAFSWRATEAKWTHAAAKERTEQGLSTPPREIDDVWYRLDGDGYFDGQRFHLHLLNVDAGTTKLLFDRDTMGTFTYEWSPDGGALVVAANCHARAAWESKHTRLFVVSAGAKGRHAVAELANQPEGPKSNPRWSPDGSSIAYAGRRGEDGTYSTRNLELWVYDLKSKKARSLTGKTDYCMMAATLSDSAEASFEPQLRWAQDSCAIFMRIGWQGSGFIASVATHEPRGGAGVVLHTEPGADHALGSLSDDGTRIACIRSTPTEPAEVHVLEVAGKIFQRKRITQFNDALVSRLALSMPEERWVKAKDGARVQAWVMRPTARRRKGPAVLEVHGGPHAQYGLTFFLEFQVLCAQGYTVWFSNPRGSKGYGEKHCAAIRGAWGTKDWIDVQAVTAAMRKDAGTDPARMGIMGGSYGGYMSVWAIGHTHEFAGAITDRCVSNLVAHAGNSDFPEVPDEYWKGAAWDRPQALWKASPIAHFKNVRTPTLVIHSEGDLRCNVEQGEQVFTALCTLAVPARLVRYPRETSHGMSRAGPPDMRLHRLHEIVKWWQRWLK